MQYLILVFVYRKRFATADDLEYYDVQQEFNEDLYKSCLLVERIIGQCEQYTEVNAYSTYSILSVLTLLSLVVHVLNFFTMSIYLNNNSILSLYAMECSVLVLQYEFFIPQLMK